MKLRAWMDSRGGISAVARETGIHRVTLHRWLARTHMPHALELEYLVKMSRGKLTYQGLINELRPDKPLGMEAFHERGRV